MRRGCVHGQRGGAAPYVLGGALIVLMCLLLFGLTDVARAMHARSTAFTALRAALRAAATATAPDGSDAPAWQKDVAQQRFHEILDSNLAAAGVTGGTGDLMGPVAVELHLLAPGDADPATGSRVETPTAWAALHARLPLLVLSRFAGGPVPLTVQVRCHLAAVAGQWRIADE